MLTVMVLAEVAEVARFHHTDTFHEVETAVPVSLAQVLPPVSSSDTLGSALASFITETIKISLLDTVGTVIVNEEVGNASFGLTDAIWVIAIYGTLPFTPSWSV
jgi:hypothetical protein